MILSEESIQSFSRDEAVRMTLNDKARILALKDVGRAIRKSRRGCGNLGI